LERPKDVFGPVKGGGIKLADYVEKCSKIMIQNP
jgi:hypothetical protein